MHLKQQLEMAEQMISNPFLRVLYVAQIVRASALATKQNATGEGGATQPAGSGPEGTKSHEPEYIGA